MSGILYVVPTPVGNLTQQHHGYRDEPFHCPPREYGTQRHPGNSDGHQQCDREQRDDRLVGRGTFGLGDFP